MPENKSQAGTEGEPLKKTPTEGGEPAADPQKPVEPTLDTLQDDPKKPTVGLDKYMEEKNARKEADAKIAELQTAMADLQTKIDQGATKKEVAKDIDALSKKYDLDPNFLTEFRDITRQELAEELSGPIKKIEADKWAEARDKKFAELYDAAIKDLPEYAKVVNKDVIKQLALDPKNAKKTLPQILEEAYGNAIPGKKTLETSHAAKDVEDIQDFSKVSTDAELAAINANPVLKKKYSEWTQNEVMKHL